MPEPSPERQIAFLTSLQRLLGEGSFVATYKYALLMSLADVAVEHGQDDDSPLDISTFLIAEKFVQYYWRQSTPYLPGEDEGIGQLLRQNTGSQAGIIRLIHGVHDRFEGSLPDAKRDGVAWRRLVKDVEAVVRQMPLWKLQTVGSEKLDFLYDNAGRGTAVTLKPGVGFCFRKYHSLVADLVKGAWVRYVRRFNAQVLGDRTDLQEFLFGSERASLLVLKPILLEFQHGDCFYCRRPLKGEAGHIDHFIPWSRYPVDLGHNFVLAHGTCNGNKSDRLGCIDHLGAWATFVSQYGADLDREFVNAKVTHNLPTSLRVVTWAYEQTSSQGGLTWVRGDELRPLPSTWKHVLATTLN
jgi:hypothetical protein